MTYPTLFFSNKNRHYLLKRDGVCNPVTHVLKAIEAVKRFSRGCKPRPASFYEPNRSLLSCKNEERQNRHYLPIGCVKRDGVCNPVTHVLKAIEAVKRFSRGCKPRRPASFYEPNRSLLSCKNEERQNRHYLPIGCVKRDGVCNPVTHVLKTIEAVKRFSRGCKPRPASFYEPNCSLLSCKNEGRQNRHYLALGCAIILACLTGCGNDDFDDLKQYISKVKAVPKGKIQPLPEVKVVETFIFNPIGLRDPFKPLEQPGQPDATPELSTGSGIKPDFNRRKEELEILPLEDLKMVGTVKMKSNLWGLVKASDGSIHRVQVGNYMGKNYGKIIRISLDKIELMEIVTEKPGVWREQQTSLALTE